MRIYLFYFQKILLGLNLLLCIVIATIITANMAFKKIKILSFDYEQ